MSTPEEQTADLLGLPFRVSLPTDLESPPPIIFMVHGRAGDSSVMWIFANSLFPQQCILISPRAPQPDQIGGYSWWGNASLPGAESGSPQSTTLPELAEAECQLAEFIGRAVPHFQADPTRIFGVGFSQGGACLASLAVSNPQLFAGVGILASFLPRSRMERAAANPSLAGNNFFVFHGEQDQVIKLEHAQSTVSFLQTQGAQVEFVTDQVGHKVSNPGRKALEKWLEKLL